MDDCHALHEQTLVYGEIVKAFLVAIRNTDEAERNQVLAASASSAREHFEALQKELDRVWDMYQRTQRKACSGS
jgi:hypothetical protein